MFSLARASAKRSPRPHADWSSKMAAGGRKSGEQRRHITQVIGQNDRPSQETRSTHSYCLCTCDRWAELNYPPRVLRCNPPSAVPPITRGQNAEQRSKSQGTHNEQRAARLPPPEFIPPPICVADIINSSQGALGWGFITHSCPSSKTLLRFVPFRETQTVSCRAVAEARQTE